MSTTSTQSSQSSGSEDLNPNSHGLAAGFTRSVTKVSTRARRAMLPALAMAIVCTFLALNSPADASEFLGRVEQARNAQLKNELDAYIQTLVGNHQLIKGDKGEPGQAGPIGQRGLQGLRGPQGLTGRRGPEGKEGERGETGPQGERGEKGKQGDRGDRGHQGIQGLKGDQGHHGDNGDKAEH